jgi:hypothetical protein
MKKHTRTIAPAVTRIDWRAKWERMKAEWVKAVWLAYMQDPSGVRRYCYVRPAVGTTWGELLAVRETDEQPDGFMIANPEHVPMATKQQIAIWLERFASRLPVIGADPEVR